MSSTKFGFRPRALDVTRKLPIRIRKCKKRSLKVKRNVALASSGMEKEEEMESHLQQALLAQKATSAGDSVENHVIPTPKVLSLNEDEYDRIYQQQRRFQKGKRLITFKEHVPFFLTQGSYNADSEDEDWLNTRRNIQLDDFEHIIEKLETASQTDIIKPKNAKILLQRYDTGLIEDVYDYWLQKRQKAASRKSKCPVLMPRVSSDVKKEEKTIVNPYIAFRRRLDKVQTRKKQKTELMTYEKMLQINFVMKRSIVLIGTLTQREKLKRAACEMEYSLYQLQTKRRISAEQCEHFVDECQREQQIGMENSQNQQMMEASTSGSGGLMAMKDSELIDELKRSIIEPSSWRNGQFPQMDKSLQKNLELWNAAALITPFIAAATSIDDDSAEVEKIAAVERNSSIDGRYQFKRKHGCNYRAPLHHNNNNNNQNNEIDQNQQRQSPSTTTFIDDDELISSGPFHQTHQSTINNKIAANSMYTEVICQKGDNIARRLWFRKRMGRGGRLLIDRVMISSQQRHSPPPPPTEQPQKDLNL